jgi:hypothetical protein
MNINRKLLTLLRSINVSTINNKQQYYNNIIQRNKHSKYYKYKKYIKTNEIKLENNINKDKENTKYDEVNILSGLVIERNGDRLLVEILTKSIYNIININNINNNIYTNIFCSQKSKLINSSIVVGDIVNININLNSIQQLINNNNTNIAVDNNNNNNVNKEILIEGVVISMNERRNVLQRSHFNVSIYL